MKRNIILALSILCYLTGTIPLYSSEPSDIAVNFWVATNGDDSNPGTEDKPFLTLQRARNAVRDLSSSAFKYSDVTVFIRGGTYRMQEPLELDSEDSGSRGHYVIYTAAPGEYPVLSGAIQVTNWTLHDAGLGIYKAYVGPYKSRQLYVNGNRAVRAQTTPYPAGFLPSYVNGGIEYITTALNPIGWRDPTTWTNPQDIEAVVLTQWKMMSVPIQSVGASLITMQEPAWTNSNLNLDVTTNQPGIWSFWQVTRFENAYEFLDQPGQWYLNNATGWLYYIPLAGEDINTADVELPVLETLIVGRGTLEKPIRNIQFKGLTFSYATWMGPSTNNGYVADQSGFLLVGEGHQPTYIGHDPNLVSTPGNIEFTYGRNITFYGNIFEHLGGAGLRFGIGSKVNTIDSNLFSDISSAAIILGGVSEDDHHPKHKGQILHYNKITNNLIRNTSAQYVDAAAVFVGFTRKTKISHNTIVNVPWSGIAMGWGWGLWDKGSFPGLPHAYSGIWGEMTTLTPNHGCVIKNNRFHSFLNVLWDGGAIYTTGRQGPTMEKGLLIKENVATGKLPSAGGNTFYTDGGSRYIRLKRNISYDNPIGVTYFGPPPQAGDPLPYSSVPSDGNGFPNGSDSGGCVTYGDIRFTDNYWLQAPIPSLIELYNVLFDVLFGFSTYSYYGFFDLCPYTDDGVIYPKNLYYKNNNTFYSKADLPQKILMKAGVRNRPSTIPAEKWVLPPL